MQSIQLFLFPSTIILIVVGAICARALFTARAWWFLFCIVICLVTGLFRLNLPLTLIGLTLLGWFAFGWLVFSLRVRTTLRRLRVAYNLSDKRGPVHILWAGQTFEVQVTVSLEPNGLRWLRFLGVRPSLPYLSISDRVPFGVEYIDGVRGRPPRTDGALRIGRPLALTYAIRCGNVGTARFEGVRVQLADLQGFFYHASFVQAGLIVRVLPAIAKSASHPNSNKRHNKLPPPGANRLLQAGSGSELLDLRDYLPGDPPRTIAWKVSARRDRLITKEYESEVPIRCTLFVDTSRSVRLPTRHGTPLQRLIEIAAAVLRSNTDRRDLTGLCIFDEQTARSVRPGRSTSHATRLLHLLTDAGSLAPTVRQADLDRLLPLAYAFAEEVYPELLRPEHNAMPPWVYWMVGFPFFWRRPAGFLHYLHRRKLHFFWLATIGLPFTLFLVNILLSFVLGPVPWAAVAILGAVVSLSFLLTTVGMVVLTIVITPRQRRLAAWRKRLGALLAARYGLAPGGLEAMLEDEDLLALHVQRFLADHQVPYNLPLYDRAGRYLFAAPEKVPVLGRALTEAVSRGRDNELFVLLADVLELDDSLEALAQAIRVALGRHHQVVLICPWPSGLDLPGRTDSTGDKETGRTGEKERKIAADVSLASSQASTQRLLSQSTQQSYQAAFQRVRRRLGKLGVTVICAASDEAVPLILDRINRLRGVRRSYI